MSALLAADPVTGLANMLSQPFMRNALLAGTSISALSGLVGYFVVLRGQVFAGDALSHVAYTGALAALAAGLDLRLGLFAATLGVGLLLGSLGGRGVADDVVIGTVFAWVLGLGVLFLTLYTTSGSTENGAANVNVLFGSILGITASAAAAAASWILAMRTPGRVAATAASYARSTASHKRRCSALASPSTNVRLASAW